ncbi:MAG TPA: BON domain-containing protein [Thermoanaerobaculia bacterium]|nr:BON domain-containing protein [Thermoanaerobaculia bacterium]
MRRGVVRLLGVVALVAPLVIPVAARAESSSTGDGVRTALLRLPYYGPFDLLSFEESNGKVILGGEVYFAPLRKQAEEAVREVPGVTEVVNRIEALPVSIEDDRLRHVIFARIYSDAFLARYGNPAGLWAHTAWGRNFRSWPGFGPGRWTSAPFWGLEPVGNWAIHVVVKGGRVTLYGNVAHEADRRKAEIDARDVPGVLGVDNQILVEAKAQG